jgi:desulfoferrodoxin (superoxide reductase-like protein)
MSENASRGTEGHIQRVQYSFTDNSCAIKHKNYDTKRDVSFYSKTNQMHNVSNLFYCRTTLYVFRTVFPSIIRSLRLYIRHQICHTVLLEAATEPRSKHTVSVIKTSQLMLYRGIIAVCSQIHTNTLGRT